MNTKNKVTGQGIHVVAKPTGPLCNLNCEYCFYLEKQALFDPGEKYRMSDDVLSSFITNYITSQPTPIVEFVWQGGEPTLSGIDFFKSLIMAALGLSLSFVGMDVVTGKLRFNFGLMVLGDGVGLIPLIMGLFGISEVFLNIDQKTQAKEIFQARVRELLPTLRDWKDSIGAILRGSFLGFSIGNLPGGGADVSSFLS